MRERIRFHRSFLLAALVALLGSGPAPADLIGDDETIQHVFGGYSGPPNVNSFPVTVRKGGPPELEYILLHQIETNTILLSADIPGLGGIGFDPTNAIFDYLDLDPLTVTGVPEDVVGVTLTTNIVGLNNSRVTFDASSVSVDLTGLSAVGPDPGPFSYALLELEFYHDPFCGDGAIDAGEECDDGNSLDGDGCSALCQPEPEVCDDGFDNDLDGKADCADKKDCGKDPACSGGGDGGGGGGGPQPEVCDDGIDNDEDGKTDCADKKDCNGDPVCSGGGGGGGGGPEPEVCDDGIDNDQDGQTDCSDRKDCRTDPAC